MALCSETRIPIIILLSTIVVMEFYMVMLKFVFGQISEIRHLVKKYAVINAGNLFIGKVV